MCYRRKYSYIHINIAIFRYPAINKYGWSFERDVINEWLKKKKQCPMTKQVLSHTDLRPNKNISCLIEYIVLRERYNNKNDDKIRDYELFNRYK